jgi:hypothetical protein
MSLGWGLSGNCSRMPSETGFIVGGRLDGQAASPARRTECEATSSDPCTTRRPLSSSPRPHLPVASARLSSSRGRDRDNRCRHQRGECALVLEPAESERHRLSDRSNEGPHEDADLLRHCGGHIRSGAASFTRSLAEERDRSGPGGEIGSSSALDLVRSGNRVVRRPKQVTMLRRRAACILPFDRSPCKSDQGVACIFFCGFAVRRSTRYAQKDSDHGPARRRQNHAG